MNEPALGGDGLPGGRADPYEGLIVHFLGTATPRHDLDRLSVRDRYPHTAANELQWCYVDALRKAGLGGLHVFSAPAVSEYPRYPKVVVSARSLGLSRDGGIDFIPYINLMGIKQVTQLVAIIAAMSRRLWRSWSARGVVLVYSLQSPFLLASFFFRALLGTPVVVIIPDLPQYMHLQGSGKGLRAILKSLDVRLGRRLIRMIDGAIVVAKAIAIDCLSPGTRYLVVDSIRDVGDSVSDRRDMASPAGMRSIFYSGGLYDAYGVRTLLEAFRSMEDPGCELWLAGKGELEPLIRQEVERDPRIRYLGHLPVSELRRFQSKASLLVSVKPSRERFTQYSFPSKITEYMASGRPVASTVTPAIGEEYFRYIHRLADESAEAMKQSIMEIFRRDPRELSERAQQGVEFLRRTRSPAARGRELAAFLASFHSRSLLPGPQKA